LRSFLKKNRALCTGALCVSAYHIYLTSIANEGSQARRRDNDDCNQLYTEAIAGLRQHVEDLTKNSGLNGLKDSLDVLACLILLVFLDVRTAWMIIQHNDKS
jgi:hypothetical protein